MVSVLRIIFYGIWNSCEKLKKPTCGGIVGALRDGH